MPSNKGPQSPDEWPASSGSQALDLWEQTTQRLPVASGPHRQGAQFVRVAAWCVPCQATLLDRPDVPANQAGAGRALALRLFSEHVSAAPLGVPHGFQMRVGDQDFPALTPVDQQATWPNPGTPLETLATLQRLGRETVPLSEVMGTGPLEALDVPPPSPAMRVAGAVKQFITRISGGPVTPTPAQEHRAWETWQPQPDDPDTKE